MAPFKASWHANSESMEQAIQRPGTSSERIELIDISLSADERLVYCASKSFSDKYVAYYTKLEIFRVPQAWMSFLNLTHAEDSSSDKPKSEEHKSFPVRIVIITGIAVGASILTGIIFGLVCICLRRR